MIVDLPDPLTPVMLTSERSGMVMSMFWRLLPRHPFKRMNCCLSVAFFSSPLPETCIVPVRYFAVSELGLREVAVPCATISPPYSPAPGPRSMISSASSMVSLSCSTTRTVLPRSLRRLSDAISLWLSRW